MRLRSMAIADELVSRNRDEITRRIDELLDEKITVAALQAALKHDNSGQRGLLLGRLQDAIYDAGLQLVERGKYNVPPAVGSTSRVVDAFIAGRPDAYETPQRQIEKR